MVMSIKNLTRAIDEGWGPTYASQFKVDFSLPQLLRSGVSAFQPDNLSILCQYASMPGVQIATTELGVYGAPVKMPYGIVYQDLAVSFLCTNLMAERKLFEEWRRLVIDPTTNYVNYYDDYIGNIVVQKLDQDGAVNHSVIYEEAWPVALFEQELASSSNDILRLTVQFAYRRWRSDSDLAAARRAEIDGTGEIAKPAQPPGKAPNPNDMFAQQPVRRVPKGPV